MIAGVARPSLLGSGRRVFKFNISSNQVDANLRTLANNAGYTGSARVEATILSGVDCYASSVGTYGLQVGSWPANSTITLINKGYITGCGGAGAQAWLEGNPSTPSAAQAGGTALYSGAVSGFTFKVDNSVGVIRGGGGGGGWGADGYNADGGNSPNDPLDGRVSGGGGGGGRGTVGGAGGGGGNYAGAVGSNGAAGSGSGGGAGGGAIANNNGIYGGAGGTGGDWGSPGSGGSSAPSPQYFPYADPPDFHPIGSNYGAGSGGAAGYAVIGTTLITWIAVGTRYGSIA